MNLLEISNYRDSATGFVDYESMLNEFESKYIDNKAKESDRFKTYEELVYEIRNRESLLGEPKLDKAREIALLIDAINQVMHIEMDEVESLKGWSYNSAQGIRRNKVFDKLSEVRAQKDSYMGFLAIYCERNGINWGIDIDEKGRNMNVDIPGIGCVGWHFGNRGFDTFMKDFKKEFGGRLPRTYNKRREDKIKPKDGEKYTVADLLLENLSFNELNDQDKKLVTSIYNQHEI